MSEQAQEAHGPSIESAPLTQPISNLSSRRSVPGDIGVPLRQQQQQQRHPRPIHRLSIPMNMSSATYDSTLMGTPVIPPHTAARVLKGEIHNVLTVLRADPRYVPLARFDMELVEQDEHALLGEFRDLHVSLCTWESAPQSELPSPLLYLPPFCQAITGRDVNASVTGAALSALHKFLLYGFLTNGHGGTGSSDSANISREGMTLLSNALLQCTFEETTTGFMGTSIGGETKYFEPNGGHGLGASQHGGAPSGLGNSGMSGSAMNNLESSSRGKRTSSAALKRNSTAESSLRSGSSHQVQQQISHQTNRTTDSTNSAVVGTMLLRDDEQVVLKLLELSALVVRCSLHPTEPLVSTDLILGLLDTCLHVSHRATQASPLLKSAAADSLGQIVLQVFSAITSPERASSWGRCHTFESVDDTNEPIISNLPPNQLTSKDGTDDEFSTNKSSPLLETRRAILLKLTHLLNPQQNNDATCATSLTLMNMAFETLREDFTSTEIKILQNDFCKYLLQWSTTHDLMILNLTLRVIFNLFQSMRNHLKVPLEVFLTSVHLRILEPTSSATSEEREVALESLLEFCQEVALMQDIYLNYDCDISCTNLYESICTTLGRVVCADGINKPMQMMAAGGSTLQTEPTTAISGGVDPTPAAIALGRPQSSVRQLGGKGAGSSETDSLSDLSSHDTTSAATTSGSKALHSSGQHQPQIPLNILNKLALDGILAILDSIFRRCQSHLRFEGMNNNGSNNHERKNTMDGLSVDETSATGSLAADADFAGSNNLRSMPNDEVLQERKIKKHYLAIIAKEFNENVFKDDWIKLAKERKILHSVPVPHNQQPSDDRFVHPLGVAPDDVAKFLYTTQYLDKANIGEYISKGPKEKYPFHAQVLDHFVRCFDFSETTFAGAIRRFLSKFRLPGEAQCIDRLMDAFAKELYKQQKGKRQIVESWNGSEDEKKPAEFIFKNSDAVFVLSFSTIMLNTDLHNPSMKKRNRMTLEQFVRNNRGINDSEDFPVEFMTELYNQIKAKEIQVNAEVGEFFSMTQTMMDASTSGSKNVQEAFRASWDSVLSSRRENAAEAFFTSPYTARQSIERAGVHDKEMFVTIAKCGAVKSLATVFCRSWDDDLVVRALRGLKQMAKTCEFFDTDEILNEILQFQLVLGRDYIKGCTALEHSGYETGAPILPNGRMPMAVLGDDNDESAIIDKDSPVPHSLLCTPKGVDPLHASFAVHIAQNNLLSGGLGDGDDATGIGMEDDDECDAGENVIDVTGSAAHRGLLALDTAFLMLRSHAPRVREAWPAFIDCICALRDARGLPAGLSDLDDFADSNGNVLPLSPYAIMSQKQLDDYYRVLLGKDDSKEKKSWLRSLWGQKKSLSTRDAGNIGEESEHSVRSGAENTNAYISPPAPKELSTFSLRLLDVAENCEVEKVVAQMGSSTGNEDEESPEEMLHHEQQFMAIQALLTSVDEYPFNGDPVLEQHAIFSLELAARALLTNRERAPDLFNLFLIKFESILGKVDDHQIPAPFMVERVVVTVLRSSIHLYDLPELRPHLRASLHLLMMSLPRKFIAQISDRMACGLAIILRASFHYFETPNEWTFMGDTLDMLANYSAARGFVFDGIASTVEYALPSPPEEVSDDHLTSESASTLTFEQTVKSEEVAAMAETGSQTPDEEDGEQPPPLSKDACLALTRILIRFVLGFYQNDLSLSLPAMLCLEKVYRHLVVLKVAPDSIEAAGGVNGKKDNTEATENGGAAARDQDPLGITRGKVPDKELWQNVVVSVYSVCRSIDEEHSNCGMECYSRIMKETAVDEIPDDKWLAILYLMVNKQPPLTADVSRANTFTVLGIVLMKVLPPLSHRSENWEDLTDLIQQIASVAEENLREGRRGSVSPLFQKTVESVTACANAMMSNDFEGDKEFSNWASETLLAELEKFGALGGIISNNA